MNERKPKISVIVPVYNVTSYLQDALESVRDQTLQDFEVIIVDDGSNQPEKIKAIAERPGFKRLKILRHPDNRGLSAARNTGLVNAEGEYIAFLDGDDLFLPQKFEIQSRLLDENPTFGMVYSDEYHLEGGREFWEETPVQFQNGVPGPSGWILDDFLKRSFIAVMTVMVRAKIMREMGGFELGLPYNEDDFLWYRIMIHYPVLFSGYVSGVRRLHDTNMSDDREKMTRFQLQSFHRLMSLYPAELSGRKTLVQGRARSVMKSYLKYCLFEYRIPKTNIIRDFFGLMKAALLLIHTECLPAIGGLL